MRTLAEIYESGADIIHDLEARIEALETVVRFYGDETNHDLDLDKHSQFTTSPIYEDRGQRARDVIGER